MKIGLNPSAGSGQPTNLADFDFGLMTDPQEELLDNRGGVAFPHPWGHKSSFPGACFYHKARPQEWLCLVSYPLPGGLEGRLLPCSDFELELPTASGLGLSDPICLSPCKFSEFSHQLITSWLQISQQQLCKLRFEPTVLSGPPAPPGPPRPPPSPESSSAPHT